MQATDMVVAFNTHNDKRHWRARADKRGDTEVVHFTATSGMVSILYHTDNGRFSVEFNKLQAAWGDYLSAIGSSLYVVLNGLAAGGLPFDPIRDPDRIIIRVEPMPDRAVYVGWEDPTTAIMPEQAPGFAMGLSPADTYDLGKALRDAIHADGGERYKPAALAFAYDGKLVDNVAQMRNSVAERVTNHAELIAAGFKWDGMDGYVSPSVQKADAMAADIEKAMTDAPEWVKSLPHIRLDD